MAEQNEQGNDGGRGDNYSNIDVRDSTGIAIGTGASSRVSIHGIDGKDLERVFMQVNEFIESLDGSKYDKQRLEYAAADLKEELAKPAPDSGLIERFWNKLKSVAEIARLLLPLIQRFLQQD